MSYFRAGGINRFRSWYIDFSNILQYTKMISLSIVKSFYKFDEIDFKFGNIVGYEA